MQGLGNDYIYLDFTQKEMDINVPKLCKVMCKHKFSVGADGIIVLKNSQTCDAKMEIYNSDGSSAKMCGNATRCVSFYLSKKLNKKNIQIECDSGVLKAKVFAKTNNYAQVLVKMGKVEILKTRKYFHLVNCGNKHLVVFVKNFNFDVKKIGKKVNKITNNKVNIEFVQILSKDTLRIKVYERGSGVTLACGSGAVASAYVYKKICNNTNKVKVCLDGGMLDIFFKGKNVFMYGGAKFVYKGECCFDEYCK